MLFLHNTQINHNITLSGAVQSIYNKKSYFFIININRYISLPSTKESFVFTWFYTQLSWSRPDFGAEWVGPQVRIPRSTILTEILQDFSQFHQANTLRKKLGRYLPHCLPYPTRLEPKMSKAKKTIRNTCNRVLSL